MKSVVRIQRQSKVKDVGLRALAKVPAAESVDSTVALIQALIPLGLKAVGEALNDEVTAPPWRASGTVAAAGALGRSGGAGSGARSPSWTRQLPVTYQRGRDRLQTTEIPLPTYQQLQQPRAADTGRFRKVLEGLSCRRYAACAEAVPAAFGLSPSTGSRRFIRASATKLYDFVALLLDGKTFAEDTILIALGITLTGEKVILGFVQTATENEPVSATFLRELVERGRHIEDGLLGVLDGAKGLRKAIQTVFGAQALVQRCQVAQARECHPVLAEGSAGHVAAEAPGRLRAADLRRGDGGPAAAPQGVDTGQRVGGQEPGRRSGGDPHPAPAGPVWAPRHPPDQLPGVAQRATRGVHRHGRSVAQLRPAAALGGQCAADH